MSAVTVPEDKLLELQRKAKLVDELAYVLEEVAEVIDDIDEWNTPIEVSARVKEVVAKAKGGTMTPEQQEYFNSELNDIRRGGSGNDVWVVDRIAGMGSENLGPVDPPAVAMCGEDPYYVTYFNSWDEVNGFVKHLTDTAVKAFGADNTTLVINTGGQVAVRPENNNLYTFLDSGVQTVSIGKEE